MKWLILGIAVVGSLLIGRSSILKNQACPPQRVFLPDGSSVNLEVALTPEQQRQGLAHRQSLSTDAGMLFLFPKNGIYPFWMKDTLIPLDLIWLNQNIVVEITSLSPAPNPASDTEIPHYTPKHEANAVIELNQGQAETRQVVIGRQITWQSCE